MSNGSLINRMIRAAKLDIDLYEEVENDSKFNGQAFAVVLIVSLIAGIGATIDGLISTDEAFSTILWALLLSIGAALVGWLLWALSVYLIGTVFFKTKETDVDYGQLLRTLGFSTTPTILGFFLFIPILGGLLSFIGWIWMIVAGVIAVRQAMDFSTLRAIGTCIVGLIPYFVMYAILGAILYGGSLLF